MAVPASFVADQEAAPSEPTSFVPDSFVEDASPAPQTWGEKRKAHYAALQAQIEEDRKTYGDGTANSFLPGSPAENATGIARLAYKTGDVLQGAAEGVGQFQAWAGRGIGQIMGLSTPEDAAAAAETDAPLLATPAGFVGNMLGGTVTAGPVGGAAEQAAAGAAKAVAPKLAAAAPRVAAVAARVASKTGPVASVAARAAAGGAVQGGVTGALAPVEPGQSRLQNAAVGAAAGAVLGPIAPALAEAGMQQRLAQNAAATQTAVKDRIALSMINAGFKVNPLEARNDSMGVQLATAVTGKMVTEQNVAVHNQEVTNKLAAQALEGFGNQPLAPETVDAYIHSVVQDTYAPLRAIGDVSTTGNGLSLIQTVGQIGVKLRRMATQFGGDYEAALRPTNQLMARLAKLKSLNVDDMMTLIADQRKNAFALIKEARVGTSASARSPTSLHAEAQTALGLADGLEDFLGQELNERATAAAVRAQQLASVYQQNRLPMPAAVQAQVEQYAAEAVRLRTLLGNYQAGRQKIARAVNVQQALEGSPDINAWKLAEMKRKNVPLGGGLELIADAANAYPRAMKPAKKVGGAQFATTVDTITGAVGGAAAVSQGQSAGASATIAAGLFGLRGLIRTAMLSRPVQRRLFPRPVALANSTVQRAAPNAAQVMQTQGTLRGISVMNQ